MNDYCKEGLRYLLRDANLKGLLALHGALISRSDEIVQGQTAVSFNGKTCCAACPVAYAYWYGEGWRTADEVRARWEIALNWNRVPRRDVAEFLHWFDSSDRETAFQETAEEISEILLDTELSTA